MGKAKTILVIEDEEDIRALVSEALEMDGYLVVPAANGQEGIDALRVIDPPQLIILDLMMPVKDGYQFRLEQTAEPRWRNIPVIVMTADANAVQRMRDMGGTGDSLRKPVDLDELMAAVNRRCGRAVGGTVG